jgi:hypothetical protein
MRRAAELRQVKHPTWNQRWSRLAKGLKLKARIARLGLRTLGLIRRQLLEYVS